jgi:hypothetical protein
MTPTPFKPPHVAQARAIIKAELAYKRAKDELEARKRDRAKVRARYAALFPLDQLVEIAGHRIKRFMNHTGVSFRLAQYLEHHEPTDEMRPHMGESGEYEDWSVTPIKRAELP